MIWRQLSGSIWRSLFVSAGCACLLAALVPDAWAKNFNADSERAQFSFCHGGGGTNCVVDGDSIWYLGRKIRIADIDTPETHPARCAEEERLGSAATARLLALLNAGAFTLSTTGRKKDVYGRDLRVLTRNGVSIGGVLVKEGLAHWYDGGRRPWC